MRMIDADALEFHRQLEPRGNGEYEYVDVIYKNDVDDAPTIEERKTGKWIHDGFNHPHGVDWCHCSICGNRDSVDSVYTQVDMYPYCAKCGAKMNPPEGGEDG